MILIADSGSTKTDWLILKKDQQEIHFKSPGLNPFYLNRQEILTEIEQYFPKTIPVAAIEQIFFYGAGCGTLKMKATLHDILQFHFPNAEVAVNNDILGAARAVFQNEKGLAVILGTGASSCLYDGSDIKQIIPPLGYVLGDEGSGASLGKMLVKNFLGGKLPRDLQEAFQESYKIDIEEVKSAVYSGKRPNLYLASFTPFLSEHMNHPFVVEFLEGPFSDMFHYQVLQFDNSMKMEVRMVGSVAFYFANLLREIAAQLAIQLTTIILSPIDELGKFHLRGKNIS